MLPKPEAVKVDLPSLNPARPDRKCNKKTDVTVCIYSFAINLCVCTLYCPSCLTQTFLAKGRARLIAYVFVSVQVTSQEQKRSLPAPILKTRALSNQSSAIPDILTCMLKDTTSEHKTHLFDLKCKICTGK